MKTIPEGEETSRKIRRRTRITAVIAATAALLLSGTGGLLAAMVREARSIQTDLGQPVRIPLLEHPFYSHFCRLESGTSLPDTENAAETEVTVRMLGVYRRTIPVTIRDLVPPEVEARDVTVFVNMPVEPEDFVLRVHDRTELTFCTYPEPDCTITGDTPVVLQTADEGGNVVLRRAMLHVLPEEEIPRVEFGADRAALTDAVSAHFPDFCSFDYTSVDLTRCGCYPVEAMRGSEPGHLRVIVEDTTPPEGTLRQLDLRTGQSLTAEELVENASDHSPVTATFSAEPDWEHSGVLAVPVLLTDEAGNSRELTTELRLWQIPETFVIETGLTTENFRRSLLEPAMPADADVPMLRLDDGFDSSVLALGEHSLTLHGECSDLPLTLTVEDTVPPSGCPNPRDLLLGDTLSAEELVRDIDDVSEVAVTFAEPPDFQKPGRQSVTVRLTDSQNNCSDVESEVMIWDIPGEANVEYGTKTEKFLNSLFASLGSQKPPETEKGFACESLEPGRSELILHGLYEDMTVTLEIADTTPPELEVRPVSVYLGTPVTAEDFVVSVSDLSSVRVTMEKTPDVSRAHEETVRLRAVDKWNNETVQTAKLTVMKDEEPPVISGVQPLDALEGETLSFRRNVSAVDAVDGEVPVTVDSSGVDTRTAGTYTVIYRAEDSSGNLAEEKAQVVIRAVGMNEVNECADSVLARRITAEQSEYEKAQAIYDWCTANIRYSTSTSYLMGQFEKAAYSGLSTGAGNCYVYYAVASALLTRCGIENQMIERDSVTSPHYWNLVKVGGSWYHFDTCPHHEGCELYSFLLTDSQVAEYSQNVDPGYYSFDETRYPATP